VQVGVSQKDATDYWQWKMTDPVPSELREKILQPFFTDKNAGNRMGWRSWPGARPIGGKLEFESP